MRVVAVGLPTTETGPLEKRLEIPMLIASVAVIPSLVVEQTATNPAVAAVAWAINALIWLAFLVEYALLFWIAPDRWLYVKSHKLDLAIVVLSPPLLVPEAMGALRAVRSLRILRMMRAARAARSARGLRLLRLFAFVGRAVTGANRALRRHGTHYVIAAVLLSVLVAGGLLHLLEPYHVPTMWDGLWWAITTVTTVGYGDITPETWIGKALAVVLMVVGIGLMAVVTANIASWFVQKDQESEGERLVAELAEVRIKLSRLEELLVQQREAATGDEDEEG
jgi:voltage-gated potassium channel